MTLTGKLKLQEAPKSKKKYFPKKASVGSENVSSSSSTKSPNCNKQTYKNHAHPNDYGLPLSLSVFARGQYGLKPQAERVLPKQGTESPQRDGLLVKIEEAHSLMKIYEPQRGVLSQRNNSQTSSNKKAVISHSSSCPYRTHDKKDTLTPRLPLRKYGQLSLSSPQDQKYKALCSSKESSAVSKKSPAGVVSTHRTHGYPDMKAFINSAKRCISKDSNAKHEAVHSRTLSTSFHKETNHRLCAKKLSLNFDCASKDGSSKNGQPNLQFNTVTIVSSRLSKKPAHKVKPPLKFGNSLPRLSQYGTSVKKDDHKQDLQNHSMPAKKSLLFNSSRKLEQSSSKKCISIEDRQSLEKPNAQERFTYRFKYYRPSSQKSRASVVENSLDQSPINMNQSYQEGRDKTISRMMFPLAKQSEDGEFSCSKDLTDVLRALKPIKVDLSQQDNVVCSDKNQSHAKSELRRFLNPVQRHEFRKHTKKTRQSEKENTQQMRSLPVEPSKVKIQHKIVDAKAKGGTFKVLSHRINLI